MKKYAYLFPILILSLVTLCIETDISAPSFPDMSAYFKVSEGLIQYTIATNFLGFCIASLFYGALSDSYGRRPIMVFGNAIMVVGAIGCVFAPTIDWLLFARFIQGLGASTSLVVAFAMMADAYQGDEVVRRIGVMNSVITTFMAFAPVAGSFINQAVGWRGNYSVVALASLLSWILIVLFLPETRTEGSPFCLKQLMKDYKTLLASQSFKQTAYVPNLICGVYLAFIACASFLYIKTIGLTIYGYAMHQGTIIGLFAVVSLFSGWIVSFIGRKTAIVFAIYTSVIGMIGLLLTSLLAPHTAILITIFMSLFTIGAAIIYPVIFSLSLEIFPDMKGVASSAIMSMPSFLIFACVGLMGTVYNDELISYVCVGFLGFIPMCYLLYRIHKAGFLNESVMVETTDINIAKAS
jgi:DHA1 family bicyclomycin/chloramphenicol resistance-like MFS transporter